MKLYRYLDYFVFETVFKHACLNQDKFGVLQYKMQRPNYTKIQLKSQSAMVP